MGALSTGKIQLTYDLFGMDPNNPSFDPNSYLFSGTLDANASVQVAGTSAVPEPSTWFFLAAVLVTLLALGQRQVSRVKNTAAN